MAAKRLDRDRIGAAALALADEGGIASVTARNLAERLEVTPMALYRHVPNLGAVLDGLVERVVVEARILDHASPTLDGFLLETFTRIYRCFVEHPAVVPRLGMPAAFGAAGLAVVDGLLARLLAAGYSQVAAVRVFHSLLSYTVGAASLRASLGPREGGAPLDAFAGLPYFRAAIEPLARIGSERSFRSGLSALIESSIEHAADASKPATKRARRRA